MYKTKKELNETRSFVQNEIRQIAKIIRENDLKVKHTLYEEVKNEDEDGNPIDFYWYINFCYSADHYSFDNDKKVVSIFRKSKLGKYFENTGSGCGFGGRDINFGQIKKIKKVK